MTAHALAQRAHAALSSPPLSQMSEAQREELLAALAEAAEFEDLPGKWQAAILAAEGGDQGGHCCGGAG